MAVGVAFHIFFEQFPESRFFAKLLLFIVRIDAVPDFFQQLERLFPRKIHADFTCLADCDANATPVNLLHKHIAFAPRPSDPAMQIRTLGVRYFKSVFRFVGFQLPNELFRKIRFHNSSLPLQPLCNF